MRTKLDFQLKLLVHQYIVAARVIGLQNCCQNTKCFFSLLYNIGNQVQAKTEVPRDVRNSKVHKQDKFRRYWSQH